MQVPLVGSASGTDVAFPGGSTSAWRAVALSVPLMVGTNTIRIRTTSRNQRELLVDHLSVG